MGCKHRSPNTAYSQGYRGFESLPLRQSPRDQHSLLIVKSASRPGIRNHAARDEPVPDKQNEDGTDRGGDEARALVGTIPADRLTEERREKRSRDAENHRQNKPGRIVGARHEKSRDHARDEANENDPQDAAHAKLPLQVSTKRARLDQAGRFALSWNAPVRCELVDQLRQLLAQTCDQLVARHSALGGERSDLIRAENLRQNVG